MITNPDNQASNKLIASEDKIFVAGHRGMAGSAICRALIKSGYQNLITVSRKDLDLRDAQAVSYWFEQHCPDVVVLAAAKVGGIFANKNYPADFLLDNIKIQNNVIEQAFQKGCKRLLFLGSSCIYPKFAEQPIQEEALLTGSLEPTNEWYAIAKIAGIQLCRALKTQHDFDALSLMPTNLYGPGDNYHPQNSHVLPAMIKRFSDAKQQNEQLVTCWGSGRPRREFLHVNDLAKACVMALEEWKPTNETPNHLNVGTGIDIEIKELARLISSSVGFKGTIEWDTSKPDGTPRKLLDVSRIQALGWKPGIKLGDGINATVEDFQSTLSNKKVRMGELQ
ncbi:MULTISPECIES: GDP-L-fucose synthase family protein [Prochlorococcus]|uniref:GDP-L-fucose synthase family protein n=1 Tax=Prochlorococcus TaxID=1218 RepID=UPI0007B36234|nr:MULTISPECIES: GDP-L-fucose synthase [Prochlorococcus]KZR66157.1 GDP-L-fucose synthase [Prochlorococcus marinus str. MIT 1312]NMP05465.1 GDP-L-fucose synthase [Prochlorococcus sp. P1361]NMP13043.1 GDP-L-fucose synthase [Prochlorococcus sp.P1363]